jgi:hypothetical protein
VHPGSLAGGLPVSDTYRRIKTSPRGGSPYWLKSRRPVRAPPMRPSDSRGSRSSRVVLSRQTLPSSTPRATTWIVLAGDLESEAKRPVCRQVVAGPCNHRSTLRVEIAGGDRLSIGARNGGTRWRRRRWTGGRQCSLRGPSCTLWGPLNPDTLTTFLQLNSRHISDDGAALSDFETATDARQFAHRVVPVRPVPGPVTADAPLIGPPDERLGRDPEIQRRLRGPVPRLRPGVRRRQPQDPSNAEDAIVELPLVGLAQGGQSRRRGRSASLASRRLYSRISRR